MEAAVSCGHIQAHWKEFQAHVKQRRSRLTDEDVARIKGRRKALIACLQESYGYQREEAQQEVRRWEHKF
jgi:uncharacterized protein YjbJ (UPF0337 family)